MLPTSSCSSSRAVWLLYAQSILDNNKECQAGAHFSDAQVSGAKVVSDAHGKVFLSGLDASSAYLCLLQCLDFSGFT